MSTVTFHVAGTPAPQGSKTRTRYGMFESSKRVKPWRDLVTRVAAQTADDEHLLRPLQAPYEVDVWFYIPKPRTTRARFPVAPTVGDLDKLVRAVGDALTKSGLIEDDRHIVTLRAEKRWAVDEEPGVIVRVKELP